MRNVRILSECRAVCGEVGSLAEAWAMPTEVRAWWISEMNREREASSEAAPPVTSDGRRILRADVPRGKRG